MNLKFVQRTTRPDCHFKGAFSDLVFLFVAQKYGKSLESAIMKETSGNYKDTMVSIGKWLA